MNRRANRGTLLGKVELHGAFPLAHTRAAVVIVHVTFGRGMLGPTMTRCVGSALGLGTVAGIAVSWLLTTRGVAAEGVDAPRVPSGVVRARSSTSLRRTVLLTAVTVSGSTGTRRTSSRLAVSVPLRASGRSALRRRRLSARHRALHLDALPEHVVITVLQHLLGGVFALERNEPKTAALVVVRISHHQHLRVVVVVVVVVSLSLSSLSSSHITTGRERRRVPTNGKPYHPDRRDIESSSSPSRVAFASRSRTSTTGPNCEKKFLTTPASRASPHIARRRQSPHRASRARLVERIPRSSRRARARPPSSPRAPSSTVRSSPPTNIFDPAAASLAPMESPMVVDDDAVRRDRARGRDRVAGSRDSSTGRDRWMGVSSRDSIRMGHTRMGAMARETRWARRETRSRARETTGGRETTAERARLASLSRRRDDAR